MKFLEMFKNKTAVRYVIFGVILFAVTIGISFFDSANDVKVTFESEAVQVVSDSYKMSIHYGDIQSAELADLPRESTAVDGKDTVVLRYGTWTNEVWGEHTICADMDCTNCVVLTITDGRILVFSSKNNETTKEIYSELLTHINPQ